MANCQNKYFISLVTKALGIKKKFNLYRVEKEYARAGNESGQGNNKLSNKSSRNVQSVGCAPKGNVRQTGFFNRFLTDDSIKNFILKSVFGFSGGILLTYICFMFLVFSLNFTLKRATYICTVLGVILSLGLAFSVKIRCTVFLCIPQLFSKRGRQALLAYAYILALSGPAKNTLHNVEVMSESLACAQEQLKQTENELLKCVHKPNAAAKKSIEKLLEKMSFAVKDFKNFILELYKNCFDILETVLHSQKWLYSISFLSNKKMGIPTHRCLHYLTETIENCESISTNVTWKKVCQVKPSSQELICDIKAKNICFRKDVPACFPAVKMERQLETFRHRAMNIINVKVIAHQTYTQSNRSYTYHEEYQGMATEIRQKTDQFLQYFDFMSVIFGIFILVLFVKVIIYRHKFLTEDHYDNRYITSDFVDIDDTRAEFQMETILPLEPRERMQYIKVTSMRLVTSEKVRLLSSFVFLIFATFKIIIHILTDSSLYWILSSIRRDERLLYMSTLREEEPSITVQVVGCGLVAAFLRNVTRAVKRQSATPRLDPTPCLPDPLPPDWNRYYQILALVIICWLLALFEPYGLRLRHTVMVTYHPDRARERAIWLYNRIISNRTTFVKISRRKLRRKYKDILRDSSYRLHFTSQTSSQKCLLCKNSIGGKENRVKCSTQHCVGLYCESCFASLKLCSICTDPAEYGDLSDFSEEKDSSEEEYCDEMIDENSGDNKGRRVRIDDRLPLNVRIPDFKMQSESRRSSKSKKSNQLIKPTLLFDAIRFCRRKISIFNQLENLSPTNSNSWDYCSTPLLGISSGEDRCFPRKKPLVRNFSFGPKPKGKQSEPALDKKISFKSVNEGRSSSHHSAFFPRNKKTKTKPDFLFRRQIKEKSRSLVKFSQIKGSVEKLKEKVSSTISCEKKPEEKKETDECVPLENEDKKVLGTEEPEFPFIDPVNIHKIDADAIPSAEKFPNEETCEICKKRKPRKRDPPIESGSYDDTDNDWKFNRKIKVGPSAKFHSKRILDRMPSSSSTDSECEILSRYYHSSISSLKPVESDTEDNLVTTTDNTKVRTSKYHAFLIEKDSTDDKYLSMKPATWKSVSQFSKKTIKKLKKLPP